VVIILLAAIVLSYLFVLQPVKSEYRAQIGRLQGQVSLSERVGLWLDATQAYLGRDPNSSQTSDSVSTLRDSLRRFDFIHIFSLVRSFSPSAVPFYQGASYEYFMVGWIPRFLWPDKPGALQANIAMILDYGMMTEAGLLTTMMTVGLLPEAYANFGYVGIAGFMALQGLFLAGLTYTFGAARSVAAQAILVAVMVSMLNGVGGSAAVVYGTLLQALVACTLVVWLLIDERGPAARILQALRAAPEAR
jgi:hypothetical protein